MDLTTEYMGLRLASPIIVGASPLSADVELAKRMEAVGAGAIVMPSLFEEQLSESAPTIAQKAPSERAAAGGQPPVTLEGYLDLMGRLKKALRIPVIASLNGSTYGGWLRYARLLEDAGASAIELNVYAVETNPESSALTVELQTLEMLRSLKRTLRIPVALKISPYYTAMAHFARQADIIGADALVLFNRFYQPDIDPVARRVDPQLRLSIPEELPLRLLWLALLSGQVKCSLAATGGVHDALGVVKSIMAGAHAAQVVSELIAHGPDQIEVILIELEAWMREHGHESLGAMRGCMSRGRASDPKAYERANYMKMLRNWDIAEGDPPEAR